MASNYYDPWGPTDTGGEGMSPLEWEEYLRRKRQLDFLKQYAAEPTPLGELPPPEQTTVGETPEQRLERLRKPLPGLETVGWESPGVERTFAPLDPLARTIARGGAGAAGKLWEGAVAWPIKFAQRHGVGFSTSEEGPSPEEREAELAKKKMYAEAEKIEKGITPEENDVFNTIKEYAEGRALKAKQVQEQMGPPGGVGEELLGGVISATGDVLPINLWGKAKLAMGPYMGLKAYAEGKSPAEAFGEGLVGQAIGMVLKAGGQLTGEYGPRVLQELPKIAKEFVSPVAGAVIGGAPVFVEQLLAGKSVRDAWRAAIEPAVTFGALATPGKARPLERMLLPEGAPKPSEIPLSPESVEAARRAGVNPEVFFDRKLPEVGPSPAEVEVAKYGEPTVARPPEALGPPTETPTAVKPAEPRVEFPELAIKPKEYTYKFNTLPIDPNIKITRDPQGGGQLAYEKSGKDVGYLDFDPSPDGRGFFIRSIDSSAKGEGVGTALWKAAAQLTNGPRRGGRGVLSFQDKDAVTREMGGQQFAKSMERRFPELVDSEELTSDIKRMEKIKQQAGLTTEYGLEENKPGGVNVRPAVLPSGDVGAGRGAPEAGGVGPSVRPAVGELGPRGSGGVEGRRGAVGEAPAPPEAERPELAPGDRVTYPNQITGKSEGGVVNPAGTLITLDGGGVRPIAAAVAAGARRVAPPVAPEAPQAATPRPEGYTAPTVTEAPPEAPVVAPAAPAPAPVTPEARPRARKPGPVVGPTETLLRELWDSGVKMPRRGESMWEELAGPRNKGGAIPPMMRRTGKGVRGQNYDMWLRRAVELGVLPEGADVSDLVRIARSPMSEAKRIDAQLRGERPDLTAQEQVEFDRAMEDAATRWTERFPEMGGKITKTGVGLQIQLKSGNKILVQENVPEIPVEAEAETKYREIHPEIAETTRLRAHGKTMRIGPNALIQIAKNAEDGTDVHEVTHVAYDMGVVTRAEDSVLGNKYAKGVADPVARQEAIADGVAVEATPKFLRRFTARVLSLGEMLQNAAARVGLAKEAVPSERRVLTDLRSGRVLRRPGPAPGAEEKFALKSEERPSWEDELKSVGGKIDPDGTVLLYHATTKGGAQEILRTGLLRRPPDAPDSYGVYFSSSREVASDYGDGTIVPVRVRATDLSPDDVFPGRRLDFSAKTSAGIYRPVSVGEEAKAKFALKPEEERRLEVIGVAPWQRTRADFEAGVSVHGANIPRGSDVEYVEPRIGEFTRTMYAGAGEGTFEEMGGKELAYFRPPGDVRSIEKYAEGVAVFPKKGEPYILVTDKPNDALFVRKDGLYDSGGNLVSHNTGLGPEPGDIVSESGAAVLYKIPLGRWRESGAGGIHEYFVREALKLGKPVPPEVLAEYPGLGPAEAQPKPVFYSKLQRTIDERMPNVTSPDQVRGIVKSGGVKPEEVEWSGLEEFLAGKKAVTKADLLRHLRENDVQVQEVMRGGPSARQPMSIGQRGERWGVKYSDGKWEYFDSQVAARAAFKTPGAEPTKFSQWQLPGGENSRELVLSLPSGRPQGDYQTPGPHRYGDVASDVNRLSHIRFNDRIGPNGERILFVEEIQGDWLQEGRKRGYATAERLPVGITERDGKYYDATGTEISREEFGRFAPDQGVPNAPFKKTWPELSMKRMIRYAAENGYDKIAWTTGEQQANRYDLSQQIDRVVYTKSGDRYYLRAYDKGGTEFLDESEISIEGVAEHVGKELANRIEAGEGKRAAPDSRDRGSMVLSGLDLKVGGEGMKGFYDQILPEVANKIGKRFGARAGTTTINAREDIAPPWEPARPLGPEVVHSLDITPAMRESVVYEGQPKFKLTPEEEKQAAAIEGVEPEGAAAAREKYRRRGAMAFTEPTTTAVRAGAEKTAEAVITPEAPRGGKPPEEFINFDRITNEADVQKALQAMADAHPEEMKAARGYRSQDKAAERSRYFTQSDLDRIVKEEGRVSDAVVFGAKQAAVAGGRAVAEAARNLEKARVDEKGVDEAEKEYLKVYNKALGTYLTSVRAGAEAGRALAMGNRIAEGLSKEDVMFQFLLKKQADPRLVAELSKLDLSNPEIAMKAIRAASKPRVADMIQEYILSAMMSGPATHIRNFVSNSVMQLGKFPEKLAASWIDAAYSKGTGAERERYAGEVGKEAGALARELWQTLHFTGNAAKAAADVWQERGDVNWGKIEATHVPALPGKVGKFIRGPLRAAGASDAWFGTIAAQQEISARTYRLAKNDVKSGKAKDVQVRMQEILSNLDSHPDILRAAKRARDYWTFRDELGPKSKKVLGLLNDMGIMRLAIAPFFKTPVKITGRFIERSPIGLMRTLAKMAKKQYGTRGEAEDDLARGLMGTAMAGAIYGFAQMGNITGMGPSDTKKKTNKMATGWQPYSIKVGDTYYSYQGMEPLSSLLMAASNVYEVASAKDHDKWVGETFRAAKDVAIDKTSLQGFQRISLAIGDPERWAKQFVQGLVGMPIPAVVARTAAAIDQTARRRDTFWDVIRSRIPGMTGELEPRRTITGKEVVREQTPLETFASPFQRTTEKPAPLERELDRLGYVPVYAPRKVVINKKDYELTQEQMQFYVEADKKAAAEALNTIKKRYYQGAPEEPTPGMKTKQEILRDIWAHQRALARMKVVREVYRGGR